MSIKIERFTVPVDKVELKGELFIPGEDENYPTVILAHGFASCQIELMEYPRKLAEKGFTAVTFDFRGHGESSGTRGYVGTREHLADIKAIYDYCQGLKAVDSQRISLFGHSLGSAAVLRLMEQVEGVRCAVLGAPMAWLRFDVGDIEYGLYVMLDLVISPLFRLTGWHIPVPYKANYKDLYEDQKAAMENEKLGFLLKWVSANNFQYLFRDLDNRKTAREVKQPVMVIVPEKDKVVSPVSGKEVYRSLTCEKQLITLTKSGHSFMGDYDKDDALEAMAEWFEKHCRDVDRTG